MKIALYLDKPKWAADNIFDGIIKHFPEHEFTKFYINKRFDANGFDFCIAHSFLMPAWCPPEKLKLSVAGIHSRTLAELLSRIERVSIAGVAAPYMCKTLRGRTKTPLMYLPYAIDTAMFKPLDSGLSDTLRVGWAGQPVKKSGFTDKRLDVIKRVVDSIDGVELVRKEYNPDKKKRDDHAEMPKFYGSLDVYVCFSKEEGYGLPIAEAAACGIPVISSNVGCVPEISGVEVVDTESDLREAIIKMRDDAEYRLAKGIECRDSVLRRLSWDVLKPRYEEFFNA